MLQTFLSISPNYPKQGNGQLGPNERECPFDQVLDYSDVTRSSDLFAFNDTEANPITFAKRPNTVRTDYRLVNKAFDQP